MSLHLLLEAFKADYDRFHGSLSPSPLEEERWKRVRDDLTEILGENGPVDDSSNPFSRAAALWQHGLPLPPATDADRDRFLHLYVLLDTLDCHVSHSHLQAVSPDAEEDASGTCLVGRRWWDTVRGRARRRLSETSDPFPHLDRGVIRAGEWLDDARLDDAFTDAVSSGMLTIGLCTLSGRAQTQFGGTRPLDSARGIYGFVADGVDPLPADELRAAVQWAREADVHILIFPELSVNGEGRLVLRDEIERDPGRLSLVVPGSFHICSEDSGRVVNSAPVWLVDRSGDTLQVAPLADARKREAFDMEILARSAPPDYARRAHEAAAASSGSFQTLREDIDASGHLPLIATPFGVFSVLICKDALVPPTLYGASPFRAFQAADHLALVSMNASPGAWFWTEADKAARQFASATYYANTPQVVALGDHHTPLAFWLLPRIESVVASTPVAPLGARGDHQVALFRALPSGGAVPHRQERLWPETGYATVSITLPQTTPFGHDL